MSALSPEQTRASLILLLPLLLAACGGPPDPPDAARPGAGDPGQQRRRRPRRLRRRSARPRGNAAVLPRSPASSSRRWSMPAARPRRPGAGRARSDRCPPAGGSFARSPAGRGPGRPGAGRGGAASATKAWPTDQLVSRSLYDAQIAALRAAEARLRQARAQSDVAGNQAGYSRAARAARRRHRHAPGRGRAGGRRRPDRVHCSPPMATRSGHRAARAGPRPLRRRPAACWSNCGRSRASALPGTIREISPAADPVTRTYAARVAFVGAAARRRTRPERARLRAATVDTHAGLQPAAVGAAARRQRRAGGLGGRSARPQRCKSQRRARRRRYGEEPTCRCWPACSAERLGGRRRRRICCAKASR